MNAYASRAWQVVATMASVPALAPHIDPTAASPAPFRGAAATRLLILGQDPTIQNAKARLKVTTVLNLDRPTWALALYLKRLCSAIGIDLGTEVYATNAVNCFFSAPPAYTHRGAVLREAFRHWSALLSEELGELPRVPVVTLGEPVFRLLHPAEERMRIRDYWGYPSTATSQMRHSRAEENSLGRPVFPFPHIRSASKKFYQDAWAGYTTYVRRSITAAVA